MERSCSYMNPTEPGTSNKNSDLSERAAMNAPKLCEKVIDETVRRQLNPCLCKQLIVARLDDKTNDSKCKMADKAVQTDIYLYTKSIKTTTIVRVHGRKKITVKREKMLKIICISKC